MENGEKQNDGRKMREGVLVLGEWVLLSFTELLTKTHQILSQVFSTSRMVFHCNILGYQSSGIGPSSLFTISHQREANCMRL